MRDAGGVVGPADKARGPRAKEADFGGEVERVPGHVHALRAQAVRDGAHRPREIYAACEEKSGGRTAEPSDERAERRRDDLTWLP